MRRFSALIAIVFMVLLAAPASAITNGQPDNEEHPYVGELIFFDFLDADFIDSASTIPEVGSGRTQNGRGWSSRVPPSSVGSVLQNSVCLSRGKG